MRIGILGSGGREAALAWKCRQSPEVEQVYVLPGNSAIEGSYPSLNPSDFATLEAFCKQESIELLIVGPEQLLVDGIADYFAKTEIALFGPKAAAAKLEGSKQYAKAFMRKYGVATARYQEVHGQKALLEASQAYPEGLVIKYDALAGGKGVWVCKNKAEQKQAFEELAENYASDTRFVLEELLHGDELSIMGIVDGKHIQLFAPSQDHKQLYAGDKGPNTGGMGAYCPLDWLDAKGYAQIEKDIIDPSLRGIEAEGFDYRGFLYFGIMYTAQGPKLLEYNVRLGDPETQALMLQLDADLPQCIQEALGEGFTENGFLAQKTGCTINVVLAAAGYPSKPEKGALLSGLAELERQEDIQVFPAGLSKDEQGQYRVTGGRVLSLLARAEQMQDARSKAYTALEQIDFVGKQYRSDISLRKIQYPFQ